MRRLAASFSTSPHLAHIRPPATCVLPAPYRPKHSVTTNRPLYRAGCVIVKGPSTAPRQFYRYTLFANVTIEIPTTIRIGMAVLLRIDPVLDTYAASIAPTQERRPELRILIIHVACRPLCLVRFASRERGYVRQIANGGRDLEIRDSRADLEKQEGWRPNVSGGRSGDLPRTCPDYCISAFWSPSRVQIVLPVSNSPSHIAKRPLRGETARRSPYGEWSSDISRRDVCMCAWMRCLPVPSNSPKPLVKEAHGWDLETADRWSASSSAARNQAVFEASTLRPVDSQGSQIASPANPASLHHIQSIAGRPVCKIETVAPGPIAVAVGRNLDSQSADPSLAQIDTCDVAKTLLTTAPRQSHATRMCNISESRSSRAPPYRGRIRTSRLLSAQSHFQNNWALCQKKLGTKPRKLSYVANPTTRVTLNGQIGGRLNHGASSRYSSPQCAFGNL